MYNAATTITLIFTRNNQNIARSKGVTLSDRVQSVDTRKELGVG